MKLTVWNPETHPDAPTLSLSPGNRKLPSIPSVSLHPDASCPPNLPCRASCYARRMTTRGPIGPVVDAAWRRNSKIYNVAPALFFGALNRYLDRELPLYFRFHVGGDIPDAEYARRVIHLAEKQPAVSFALYTQRVKALPPYEYIPSNLHIRVSLWPNQDEARAGEYPKAHALRPGAFGVNGVPWCPGRCGPCLHCYRTHEDVIFPLH